MKNLTYALNNFALKLEEEKKLQADAILQCPLDCLATYIVPLNAFKKFDKFKWLDGQILIVASVQAARKVQAT